MGATDSNDKSEIPGMDVERLSDSTDGGEFLANFHGPSKIASG
jgi:hypothetical protein